LQFLGHWAGIIGQASAGLAVDHAMKPL
jgi:hypothetical protein